MNELGPDARALLDAARDGDAPEAGARDRVRRSIAARLAVGIAAGTAVATVAKTSVASATTIAAPVGLGMKVLVGLAIATAVGMGAVTYVDSKPHEESPPTVVAAPTHAAPHATPPAASLPAASSPLGPAPSAVASPRPSVAVTAGAPPIAPGSVAPESVVDAGPPASPATVTDEIALVSRAHAALTSGDPASALALLAEHARRFPNGALGEEREATRVLALCALGRTAEARDAASRFFAAFPGGPQSGRVRASCGGASPTN